MFIIIFRSEAHWWSASTDRKRFCLSFHCTTNHWKKIKLPMWDILIMNNFVIDQLPTPDYHSRKWYILLACMFSTAMFVIPGFIFRFLRSLLRGTLSLKQCWQGCLLSAVQSSCWLSKQDMQKWCPQPLSVAILLMASHFWHCSTPTAATVNNENNLKVR